MTHSFRPNGIVTLLTDFGLQDPYVGIMKGVMLGIHSPMQLVDITHGIAPQWVMGGALALAAAWPYFPSGTVHLVVVDPGVGSARRGMVVEAAGQLFVGPDNGVLESALAWTSAEGEGARAYLLEAQAFRLARVSRTFHGRDIFAPAAAYAASGVAPAAFGPLITAPVRLAFPHPTAMASRQGAGWTGSILSADVYGNLITNLGVECLSGSGVWRVMVGEQELPLVETYASVPKGALLALVGSTGRVELSVNGGSAEKVLGLTVGSEVQLLRGNPSATGSPEVSEQP